MPFARIVTVAAVAAAAFGWLGRATAADVPTFTITVENHRFSPESIRIPAGKRVLLRVSNQDPTPEEFESYELNREKVVLGKSTGEVYIGPLDRGTYPFFGDFHQDTAKGRVIAE
jgi:Cupredoxin-like domain